MFKTRILAIFFILAGIAIGYFVYASETRSDLLISRFPFKLGLDFQGGSHLIYQADVSNIPKGEVSESMAALRDVIERRINLFGISEPLIQVEEKGVFRANEDKDYRLIVELPGVTDLEQAVAMIGQTPFLEFRIENPDVEISEKTTYYDVYLSTGLTGKFLKKAKLEFNQ